MGASAGQASPTGCQPPPVRGASELARVGVAAKVGRAVIVAALVGLGVLMMGATAGALAVLVGAGRVAVASGTWVRVGSMVAVGAFVGAAVAVGRMVALGTAGTAVGGALVGALPHADIKKNTPNIRVMCFGDMGAF